MTEYARGGPIAAPEGVDAKQGLVPLTGCGYVTVSVSDRELFDAGARFLAALNAGEVAHDPRDAGPGVRVTPGGPSKPEMP
jgi:hypothetical protein